MSGFLDLILNVIIYINTVLQIVKFYTVMERILKLMFQTADKGLQSATLVLKFLHTMEEGQRTVVRGQRTTVRNVSLKILSTMVYNLTIFKTVSVETLTQHSIYDIYINRLFVSVSNKIKSNSPCKYLF